MFRYAASLALNWRNRRLQPYRSFRSVTDPAPCCQRRRPGLGGGTIEGVRQTLRDELTGACFRLPEQPEVLLIDGAKMPYSPRTRRSRRLECDHQPP